MVRNGVPCLGRKGMSYPWRAIRMWAAGLAMAGIAGLLSPGRAGAQQAPTTPPYSFNLFGVINKGNVTDITLAIKPLSPSAPPPTSAKQITLQAYDGTKLVFTKTYPNY